MSVGGCGVTTRWGRIGTDGRSKTKTFADGGRAQAEADKLVEEKPGTGYIER